MRRLWAFAGLIVATTAAVMVPRAASADPSLDLELYGPTARSPSSYAFITYANNSGLSPVKGLLAAQTLVGAASPGVLVATTAIETSGYPLTLWGANNPTILTYPQYGYAGSSVSLYYSHVASGAAGSWDQRAVAPIYYVAAYVTCNSANICFTSNPVTSPGHVQGTAALQLSVRYGVDNSVWYVMSNAAFGGPLANIIGPGVPNGVSDGTSTLSVQRVAGALVNTTPELGPSGASNIIARLSYPTPTPNASFSPTPTPTSTPTPTAMPTPTPTPTATPTPSPTPSPAYGVLNGPAGRPDAAGMVGGYTSADQNGDFSTAVLHVTPRTDGSVPSTATGTFVSMGSAGLYPQGQIVNVPANTSVAVRSTLKNSGNVAETFALSADTLGGIVNPLPAVWSTAFYAINATNNGPDTTRPFDATHATPAVSPNATLDFYTVYTAPASGVAMNAFAQYATEVFARVIESGAAAIKNRTYHTLYVNGYIGIVKTLAVDNTTGCASATGYGAIVAPVCSGTKLTYTIAYRNVLEPSISGSGNVTFSANNFVISENGADPSTGWALSTYGLTSAPVDSNNKPVSYTAQTFSVAIGTLAPGESGTITFSVVVR